MTNYFSFILYPYNPGLIRTLVDRAYKINNTWLGFYEDIKKLTEILKKDTTTNFYFKSPYIGHFSFVAQKRVRRFAKCYCNNIDIKLVFSSFKIADMFGVKDPRGLRTCVLYKFLCADSNACYVCETPRHLSTRVGGHLQLIIDCILKFSDIYIILHNVVLFVLMSIVTS